jgi:hypothetical protein
VNANQHLPADTSSVDLTVKHQRVDLNGLEVFYCAAGSENAPVVLPPHGYPCSSFQFRNLMPALADRWRSVAPDFPVWHPWMIRVHVRLFPAPVCMQSFRGADS